MNILYNLSALSFFVALIGMIIGLIKPHAFSGIFKKHANRKFITAAGVSTLIALGSFASATEPASVKQARLDKENAKKIALTQSTKTTKPAEPAKTEPTSQKKDLIEKRSVPFSKEQRNDASLAAGKTAVVQAGKDGEKTITYEVTYINGKETFRSTKSDVITTPAVSEITSIGTYVAPAASTYVAPQTTSSTAPSTTRTGATCRDGSHSNATGSGACSHHGGVAVWLYH